MSQDNGAHVEAAQPQMRTLPRAQRIRKKRPEVVADLTDCRHRAVAVVIGVTLAFGGKKDDKSASSSNQYADTVTIGLKLAPHQSGHPQHRRLRA